jgi:hypothetical protein
MPLHLHKPRIDDIKVASDARINLSLQNSDGTVPSLAGGTGTVTLTPRGAGTAATKSIVLSPDPTAQPQCYVALVPTDTDDWAPGTYDAYGTVSAGGKTYKPSFWGRVLASAAETP